MCFLIYDILHIVNSPYIYSDKLWLYRFFATHFFKAHWNLNILILYWYGRHFIFHNFSLLPHWGFYFSLSCVIHFFACLDVCSILNIASKMWKLYSFLFCTFDHCPRHFRYLSHLTREEDIYEDELRSMTLNILLD